MFLFIVFIISVLSQKKEKIKEIFLIYFYPNNIFRMYTQKNKLKGNNETFVSIF